MYHQQSYKRPSFSDVKQAIDVLDSIARPDSDNEGEPINSPAVLDSLDAEVQTIVAQAVDTISVYARNSLGETNRRSINTLTKKGFNASLGPDQYDHTKQVGSIHTQNWEVDISD